MASINHCTRDTHLVILILVEREGVARCNSDLQHLHFCSLFDTIISTVRGAQDGREGYPVGFCPYVGSHLLENLVYDQSKIVLLFTVDNFPVDDPCLAYTKTKDSPVSIQKGTDVLRQDLWSNRGIYALITEVCCYFYYFCNVVWESSKCGVPVIILVANVLKFCVFPVVDKLQIYISDTGSLSKKSAP